jgi:3-oxoacyl-[acyl-carrier-protein] synthase-3
MDAPHTVVGIVAAGVYLPEPVVTAADIAAASGIPEGVIREKFGITRKHVPGPADHTNQMGIWAAQDCLAKSDIKPDEIDLVLCTTEEWKEHLLWTAGIKLAHAIGATRAWALDVQMRCGTTIAALKLARDLMTADLEINTVLIAGGYRNCDLVNYRNQRTTFLFNLAAGGGALLLRRDWPRNRVLGSHLMADGSMADHVLVPASGTVQFPTDAARASGLCCLDLVEPEAMKNRLNAVSMDNWMHCIEEALRKSGCTRGDIGYLNILHMKRSAHLEMLQRLGLAEDQSVYLSDYGHIGQQDAPLSIVEGLKQGRLKDGDLMVIVAAGIGYAWGAACVRWG